MEISFPNLARFCFRIWHDFASGFGGVGRGCFEKNLGKMGWGVVHATKNG